MSNRIKISKVSSLVIALMMSHAYGAGFKLEFQSPSVLADSGDAAVVEDAGTNWYNSAGNVYLPQQFAFAGTHVYNRTQFSGTQVAPGILGAGLYTANGHATSYGNVDLPAIHYVLPFAHTYAFGLSIVPAWGLLEDYGENSIVRYDLDRVYTKTLDIAPSLSARLNSQLSIGIGPDMHYFYLSSNTHVYTAQPVDSISRISAGAWGYGGHLGLLYRYNDATRIGLNYRTRIVNNLQGYSDFALWPVASFESNTFKVSFIMPPTTSLSIYHDCTPNWALMGTITLDQWSVVKQLYGRNYMTPTGALTNLTLPQKFSNTVDFGLGTHYRWNDQWLLRASVKYEQTPTNNSYRDINFPDGQKLGVNLGARYTLNRKVAFDLIYAHVFTRTVPIQITNAYSATTSGHSSARFDIFGAQLVWNV